MPNLLGSTCYVVLYIDSAYVTAYKRNDFLETVLHLPFPWLPNNISNIYAIPGKRKTRHKRDLVTRPCGEPRISS